MGGLLNELGKRLADRWLPLLVLPGAFYLAVAITARTLGQSRPFDLHRLIAQVIAWAKTPAATTVGGQVVLLAAALAGSAAAGLAAQAVGSVAERLTLAAGWSTWMTPLRQFAGTRVESRQRRWDEKHAAYSRHHNLARESNDPDPGERHAAYRARTRIGPERPARPTWSGDRINAVDARLTRDLHLDLATIWPALWLTLPGTARTEITHRPPGTGQRHHPDRLGRAVCAAGRLVWPASLIAIVLAATGWHRTRTSADAYATLLEASTRLYGLDLAHQLGVGHTQFLDQQTGESLTGALYTEPPPLPSP